MKRIVTGNADLRIIIRTSRNQSVAAVRCGVTRITMHKHVQRLGEIVGGDLRHCVCCREPFLTTSSANAACPICVATDTAEWVA